MAEHYSLPLRPNSLPARLVSYLRSHPGSVYTGEHLAKQVPTGYETTSYSACLSKVVNQGGPVERIGHGLYRFLPEQDGPLWAPGGVPEAEADNGADDDNVALYNVLGFTQEGETIIQSETGAIGIVRWLT